MFVFLACPGTIPLSTLFVTMQFLLIPDNRTVLNVKPWHLTGLAHKHTLTLVANFIWNSCFSEKKMN